MKDKLIGVGGDQLFIHLTGVDGTGESLVIFTGHYFCKEFSASVDVISLNNYIMIEACQGYVTALLDGVTIHKDDNMNYKRITDEIREEWKSVRIIFYNNVLYYQIHILRTGIIN